MSFLQRWRERAERRRYPAQVLRLEEFRPEMAVVPDTIDEAVHRLLDGQDGEPLKGRDPDIEMAEAEGHDITGQGFWGA